MTCPWHTPLNKAAHAAPALIRHLDPRQGFASPKLRWGFQHLSGFACQWPAAELAGDTWTQADADWLGAVLAKIAQRGLPAPCSLALERHLLDQAQAAGLLTYQASPDGGEQRFTLTPAPDYQADFADWLQACLYPELLVSDADLAALLAHYAAPPRMTPLEKDLFDRLRQRLPEPRLALFVVPQPHAAQLIPDDPDNIERPDFAIELPAPQHNHCLRLILEADDRTHLEPAQQAIDAVRDRRFSEAGFHTERFRTWEPDTWDTRLDALAAQIQHALPPELLAAARRLRALPPALRQSLHDLVALPVLEAQLSVALAHAIRRQRHARLAVSGPAVVIEAVNQRLAALCDLAGLPHCGNLQPAAPDESHALTLSARPSPEAWQALERNQAFLAPAPVRHGHIPALLPAKPRAIYIGHERQRAALAALLRDLFRKPRFREGQEPIVTRALTLRPVVGLLPTGAGKSLCYQLASLVQPGFTLVVDPLRSLMLDQRNNLRAMGIHRAEAILGHGARPAAALTQPIREGRGWFVFVAPERLQRQSFLDALAHGAGRWPVAYCVIDEAHCVSEWGHDFRPAYLNVGRRARAYCRHEGTEPSLLALTGTASRNVLTDILKELRITDLTAIIEPKSFNRPELDFQILRVENHNRLASLADAVRELLSRYSGQSAAGLVFTYFQKHVSTSVDKITQYLQNHLPDCAVAAYSGSDEEKAQIQHRFKHDDIPLLVCTHGFGMGIDKPNIRFVVHAMLPRSVEDYYQQAGRAGRDGNPATCVVLFVDEEAQRAAELLDTEQTPPHALDGLTRPIQDHRRSDLVRNLWFITNAFPDSGREKATLHHVIQILHINPEHPPNSLSPWERVGVRENQTGFTREITPTFPEGLLPPNTRPEDRAKHLEKALYRLSLLGVVTDYTISGAITNPKYLVTLHIASPAEIRDRLREYVGQYLIESDIPRFLPPQLPGEFAAALLQCGDKLIDFMYAAVEKRRRAALGNMLNLARIGADHGPDAFRRELIAFLEESEFTGPVRRIAAGLEPALWFEILAQVRGADDVTKLLGACRRQLQETPEHPGLYLLLALCCFNSPHPEEGGRYLVQAWHGLADRLPPARRVDIAARLYEVAKAWLGQNHTAVLSSFLAGDASPEMLAFVYRHAEPYSATHHLAVRRLTTRLLHSMGRA